MTFLKSFIYIASTGSSVFDSQVISLLKELRHKDYFSRIILLAGVKTSQNWNKELSQIVEKGLDVILFRQYPNYPFFKYIQKIELLRILKRILTDNTIIHLRGEFFTKITKDIIVGERFRNVIILTDIRGFAEEEIRVYLKGIYNPVKYYVKLFQAHQNLKNVGKFSDCISCVSESLLEVTQKRTAGTNVVFDVNHSIASRNFRYSSEFRSDYRLRLGIGDEEVLFIFVTGGYSLYENVEEVVGHLIKQGHKFLNLSKVCISGAINLYVPYSEVPNYLCAADIGIVWRGNNLVNFTSSPVKISEYLCCGLPVVANSSIKLLNDFIEQTGYGKIISNPLEIDTVLIDGLVKMDRELISIKARNKFSSEVIVNQYIRLYEHLLKRGDVAIQ